MVLSAHPAEQEEFLAASEQMDVLDAEALDQVGPLGCGVIAQSETMGSQSLISLQWI